MLWLSGQIGMLSQNLELVSERQNEQFGIICDNFEKLMKYCGSDMKSVIGIYS